MIAMPGRVFISCGQRSDEMRVVSQVKEWLTNEGFEPYVALAAQSLSASTPGSSLP